MMEKQLVKKMEKHYLHQKINELNQEDKVLLIKKNKHIDN